MRESVLGHPVVAVGAVGEAAGATAADAGRGVDPESFGVRVVPEVPGVQLVLNAVALDLAAQCGTERLPWDSWGLAAPRRHRSHTADDLALADAMAGAGSAEEPRRRLRRSRPAVPRRIQSYAAFLGPRTVTLPQSSAPRV